MGCSSSVPQQSQTPAEAPVENNNIKIGEDANSDSNINSRESATASAANKNNLKSNSNEASDSQGGRALSDNDISLAVNGGGGAVEDDVQHDLILSAKYTVNDFDFLKVLGKGTFGKVQLVQKKSDGIIYAMKTLKKKDVKQMRQEKNTECERYILQSIKSPFLITLHFAFQDSQKLHMVVDFVGGGEVFTFLRKQRIFSEARARLYAAEIVLGIDALHMANIVYRDIKSENLLLDNFGHIKICDFGLSKRNITTMDSGAKTNCGTAELMAPEIYAGRGYGKAVDWWALGILIYQMTHGIYPFEDPDEVRLMQKIMNTEIKFSDRLSKDCKETIKAFCSKSVKNRLGSSSSGITDIKRSAFFSKLDWTMVLTKRVKPEFIPEVDKELSKLVGFDKMFTELTPGDSYRASMTVNEHFEGFTYRGQEK